MVTKPNDVLGWSNTHWGMSEIEVLRLFPGEAERLDAGIEFRNPKRFATVRIPDRAIDGKRLTILFFFDVNDGLSEVILKPLPAKPIGYFEPLFGLLKQKYGSATLTDKEGVTDTAIWLFPSSEVKLIRIDATSLNMLSVAVSYRAITERRLANL